MLKKILFLVFTTMIVPAYAYEDCVLTTDGKLTEIVVENKALLQVYPVVTIMNEKNTLIIHPLQVGSTKFSVLKDGIDRVIFNVNITENETKIDEKEDFEILPLDIPPEILDCDIDSPPVVKDEKKNPPKLRGEVD